MFLNVQGRGIAARWRAPQAADESRRTGRRPQASRKRSPPKELRLRDRNRRLPAHDEAALREAESFRLAELPSGEREVPTPSGDCFLPYAGSSLRSALAALWVMGGVEWSAYPQPSEWQKE